MPSPKSRLDRLTKAIYFDGNGPLWGGLQPTTIDAVSIGGSIPRGTERFLSACLIDIAVAKIIDYPDSDFARAWCGKMSIPAFANEATVIGRALEYARSLGLTPLELAELRHWIDGRPSTGP
jgi:hypothetical protein